MIWFFFKVIVLISLAILIRGTLPRYRVDQLITLNWKYLIFFCITFFCQLILLQFIFYL